MQMLLSIQKQLEKTDRRVEQNDQRLAAIERGDRPHDATDYNAFRIDDIEYGDVPTIPGNVPTPAYEDKLVRDKNVHWGGSAFNRDNFLDDEMDVNIEPEQSMDDILDEIHEGGQELVERGLTKLRNHSWFTQTAYQGGENGGG